MSPLERNAAVSGGAAGETSSVAVFSFFNLVCACALMETVSLLLLVGAAGFSDCAVVFST